MLIHKFWHPFLNIFALLIWHSDPASKARAFTLTLNQISPVWSKPVFGYCKDSIFLMLASFVIRDSNREHLAKNYLKVENI